MQLKTIYQRKRKHFLLVLLLIVVGLTKTMAQSRSLLLEESFDGASLPVGWSIDSQTSNWSISSTNNAGGEANEMRLTWSPLFNGISRLISPSIDLTGINSVVFSFKHALNNYSGSNTIGVATSSDGGITWNQAWSQVYSTSSSWTVIQEITTIDMGHANVQFCIFFNGNSDNINNWYFDDIKVFTLENLDLGLESVILPDLIISSGTSIGMNVFNYGATTITSVTATYTVEGMAPVSETFNVNISSLNSETITFANITFSPGSHNVVFSIVLVNGVEDNVVENNTLEKTISVAVGTVDRIPMIEHFSSSTAGICANLNNQMNTFCGNNPGRFTYTKYAMNWPGNGDPYYTNECGARRTYYNVSGVPQLFLDGENQGYTVLQQTVFNQHASQLALMDIRGSFYISGNTIHVKADIMPYINVNARIFVSVNEKETHNNVGSSGESSFHHICMKMLPDAQGFPVSFNACEFYHLEFTHDMSGTHVEEMSDLEVSIWVQNYDTKEIFNSHYAYEYTSVHPYPVQNLSLVENNDGTLVASWSAPSQATGYRITINGEVVIENTASLSYSFPNGSLSNSTIGVQALYGEDKESVTVFGATSINPETTSYLIRAIVNPEGGGIVTGEGIYNYNQTCTLTATTSEGYTFSHWSKNGVPISNNPVISFTVTESDDYVAFFTPDSHEIVVTVNPEEGGSTTGRGVYDYGSTCTLTALANEGYTFSSWTENGNIVSTNANYSFIVTGDRTLVANFEEGSLCYITFNLYDSYGGDGWYGNKLVVTEENGTSHQFTISSGSSASYSLLLADGSHVTLGWIEGYYIGQCSFTVNYSNGNTIYHGSDLSSSFSYEFDVDCVEMPMITLTITAEANPTDGGVINGGGTFDYGSTCTLTATANEGYTFMYWTENGQQISYDTTYSFTVTNNRNLEAHFTLPYSITATANPEEGGVVVGAGEYDYHSTCTLTAMANEGYCFYYWLENGSVVSYNHNYSFIVNGNRELIGVFGLPIPITVEVNPTEGGVVNGGGLYDYRYSCTLTAIANEGYTFMNWTENGNVISTYTTYSFTVTTEREFVANFTLPLNITVSVLPEEGGTVTGAGVYNYGANCTLSAVANSDYYFVNWTNNDIVVSTQANYSFVVTGDENLVAHFEPNPVGKVTAIYDPDPDDNQSPNVRVYWTMHPNMIEEFERGDFSLFDWQLDDNHPWSITTNSPYEGDYCMKSGGTGIANVVSDMSVTVNIPVDGVMSFWGRISCESSWDYGCFYIDGVQKGSWSGNGNWEQHEYNITAGLHTFKWSYRKDGSVNSYDDCFYVDNIRFVNSVRGGDRTVNHFKVYREKYQGSNAPEIIADNIIDTCFLDTVWNTLNCGNYHYGVKACYSENGTSPLNMSNMAWSNQIERECIEINISDEICFGNSYFENGFEIFHPEVGENQYFTTIFSPYGMDTILNLTLTVHPAYYHEEDTIICDAPSFEWRGYTLTESGIYYDTLQTVHGCDSIFQLSLELFNTPVGEFTYMTPTNNYPFTSLPILFSWNTVSEADYYNLYLWNANEPIPEAPVLNHIYNRSCMVSTLQNHQTYQWYVEAVNTCYTTESSVRSFALNIPPTMYASTSSLNFGEVVLNGSNTLGLYVSGNALDDTITLQIAGEDASQFSVVPSSNWNNLLGGSLSVTFCPTIIRYNYHADLIINSGTISQTVHLSGSLADVYVFNTYVLQDVFEMNSTIPIYGTVVDINNNPMDSVEVEVKVTAMNMTRSLFATSGADGHFSVNFEPAFSESGYYTINSGRVGHNSTAVHDDFNIPGMNLVTDDWILWDVVQNETLTDTIVIRNRSQIPLTNIQVTATNLPEGCAFTFQPLSLEGMEEGLLEYSVTGSASISGNSYEEVKLMATSAEGATMNFSAWYYCTEPRGILYASPNAISTTMTKGISKIVDVMLYNNGTGPTGNISIDLPSEEWLSVVGNDTLASIAVHDSAYFSLRLTANENTPLVQYTGTIALNCERGDGLSLPYIITAVSDSTGTLVVDVTDDYTYNGDGQHLAGAMVTVKGYYSLETVAMGLTNSEGLFTVEDIPEGYYKIAITAPHHAEYRATIQIEGGQTNMQDIYLQYQAITYSWNVVPTEIEDEYTFELIVDYETHVPVPVVVIDMPNVFPELEDGESFVFDYIITNHGLVDFCDAKLFVPISHPLYEFTALITEIDTLRAQSTIVIPCSMTLRGRNRSQAVLKALGDKGDKNRDCIDRVKTEIQGYYYCRGEKIFGSNYCWREIGSHPSCNSMPDELSKPIPVKPVSWEFDGFSHGTNSVTTQQKGCNTCPPEALEELDNCPPPDQTPKLPPRLGNNRK